MNKTLSLRIAGVAVSALAVRFLVRRYTRARAAGQIEG
jgi:hypothetical protein